MFQRLRQVVNLLLLFACLYLCSTVFNIASKNMKTERNDTVLERCKSLYASKKWHDLEFLCRDEETGTKKVFLAHRLVLASFSPVFEALCYGPLAEQGLINLTDIDATAFDAMLQYIYTDHIQYKLTPLLAFNLLYIAKKYLMESLEQFSRGYLLETIKDTNCIEIHDLSMRLDDTKLINASFAHICRRMEHVKKFITNESLTKEFVFKLVTSQKINCKEFTLAELAVTFGKNACQQAGVEDSVANVGKFLDLENIIENIRWHLLDPEELTPFLNTLKEKSKKSCEIQREQLPGKLAVVQRYIVDPIRRWRVNNEDALTVVTSFNVNKSVMLTGIFLNARFAPRHWKSPLKLPKYTEDMGIDVFEESGQMIHTQQFSDKVEFDSPFLVNFSKQISVPENTQFSIRVCLRSPYSNYPFGTYSDYCKIPSGLTVSCKQFANFLQEGIFDSAPHLTVVTGFQFHC